MNVLVIVLISSLSTVSLGGIPGKVSPVLGTPCAKSCGDPSSLDCGTCCRSVEHETSWNCPGGKEFNPNADSAPACSGAWDASYWNINSVANFNHACSQCAGCSGIWPFDGPDCTGSTTINSLVLDACTKALPRVGDFDTPLFYKVENASPCYMQLYATDQCTGDVLGEIPANNVGGCYDNLGIWPFGSMRFLNCACVEVDCEGSFEATGDCSVTCGGGTQETTYVITKEAFGGGQACPNTAGQVGPVAECNTLLCPGDGDDDDNDDDDDDDNDDDDDDDEVGGGRANSRRSLSENAVVGGAFAFAFVVGGALGYRRSRRSPEIIEQVSEVNAVRDTSQVDLEAVALSS